MTSTNGLAMVPLVPMQFFYKNTFVHKPRLQKRVPLASKTLPAPLSSIPVRTQSFLAGCLQVKATLTLQAFAESQAAVGPARHEDNARHTLQFQQMLDMFVTRNVFDPSQVPQLQ
jgi:hypothetical protein